MKIKLLRNYMGFILKVKQSTKLVLRQLYSIASVDSRTVTGSNIRNILLLTNSLQVDQLTPSLVNSITYNMIDKADTWRVGLVKEIMNIQNGDLELPVGWFKEELDMMLNLACTQ